MVKVAEDSFTRSGVSIMAETQIRMWVTDDRMLSGTLDDVCKTIMIDGQEIRKGSTIYGEIWFVYKNDGRIIYVPPVL